MRFRIWLRPLVPVFGLVALVAPVSLSFGWQQQLASASFKPELEDRARRYQRPTDVLRALEISLGDWVADVGAGNGYYVQHMADLVGPTGKVYGEEIAEDAIDLMAQRVRTFDLRNVEIIKGTDVDPKLPLDSLAAVLIMNTYHHFSQHEPMLDHILRSLKPGGRLVIVDYSLPEHRSQSRPDQVKIHEIDPELVRAELGRAGFQVAKCEDPFLKRIPEATGNQIGKADMWLMIAVRPRS
jgi:predicted methyltransferase